MADDRRNDGEYRAARQVSVFVLIAVVAVIVVADSLGIGRPVDPLILWGLLITAAGLLAVDLPGMRR